MKNLLYKILDNNSLIEHDETFISESDLQLNLAKILQDNGCTDVQLECLEEIEGRKGYIDIYCKYNDVNYYLELKYKTKAKNKDCKRMGINFRLKNHSAHTDNRYLIYKDIHRLECIVQKCPKTVGYVLFLTNDDNYEKKRDNMPLLDKQLTSIKYKYREKVFNLNKQRKCEWQSFKACEGFKYLLIEIQ